MTGSEVTVDGGAGANLNGGSGVQAKRRTQVRLFLFFENPSFRAAGGIGRSCGVHIQEPGVGGVARSVAVSVF